MAILTKIPENTQVEFDDVYDTLTDNGAAGMSKSDASTMFTAQAVKAWGSRKKPIRRPEMICEGEWWKGLDGMCGMSIPSQRGTPQSAAATLSAYYDGDMNGWVYLTPRGYDIYAERYRIADFEGYDPKAKLVNGYTVSESASTTANGSMMVTMISNIDANSSSLSWSDFALGNCYLGVEMKQKNGAGYVFRTTSTPIGASSTIQIPTTGFASGEWLVTPFICSDTVLSDSDYTKTVTMYTLPKSSVKQVTLSSSALTIIPLFQYKNGANTDSVTMSLTITNPSGEVTLKNNYASLYYADSDEVDYDNNEIGPMSISDIVVPTGTTTVNIGSFTGVDSSMRLNCKVVLTLNNSQYELRQEPLADTSIPGSYTVNLNGQWRKSSVANPNSSLYDGVYESYYHTGEDWTIDKMYINIEGYNEFSIYVRGYGESNWDYVLVANLDEDITSEVTDYDDPIVYAHTRGLSNGGTAISNYTKVTFDNIGGGSHRICVAYRKDGSTSTSTDRGFLLIPKNQ